MTFPALPGALARVREDVARHQAVGGWSHPVRIVAVTKTHGPEAVHAALAAGLTDVGENRVQEALAKQDAARGAAGPMAPDRDAAAQQGTPGRRAVRADPLGGSRSSWPAELDRRIAAGERQAILVQVNCSGEPQKGGVEPAGLPALLDALAGLRPARGPRSHDHERTHLGRCDEQRRAFRLLRRAARRVGAVRAPRSPSCRWGCRATSRSAVEEGATMIRLGTVLFGEREHMGARG